MKHEARKYACDIVITKKFSFFFIKKMKYRTSLFSCRTSNHQIKPLCLCFMPKIWIFLGIQKTERFYLVRWSDDRWECKKFVSNPSVDGRNAIMFDADPNIGRRAFCTNVLIFFTKIYVNVNLCMSNVFKLISIDCNISIISNFLHFF